MSCNLIEPTLCMSGFPKSSIRKQSQPSQVRAPTRARVRFCSTQPENIFIIQSRFSQEMPVDLEELHNRVHHMKQQLRKEKRRVRRFRRAEDDLQTTIEQLCGKDGEELYETLAMQKQKEALKASLFMLNDEIRGFRMETLRVKGLCKRLLPSPPKKLAPTPEKAGNFWIPNRAITTTWDLSTHSRSSVAMCA